MPRLTPKCCELRLNCRWSILSRRQACSVADGYWQHVYVYNTIDNPDQGATNCFGFTASATTASQSNNPTATSTYMFDFASDGSAILKTYAPADIACQTSTGTMGSSTMHYMVMSNLNGPVGACYSHGGLYYAIMNPGYRTGMSGGTTAPWFANPGKANGLSCTQSGECRAGAVCGSGAGRRLFGAPTSSSSSSSSSSNTCYVPTSGSRRKLFKKKSGH